MANKRMQLISSHINSSFPPVAHDPSLDEARDRCPALDAQFLLRLYFGVKLSEIERVRSHTATVPVFTHMTGQEQDRATQRRLLIDRIASSYFLVKSTYDLDQSDIRSKQPLLYVYTEMEQGLVTMLIVQSILYLDTLQQFGTDKHRELIDRGYSFEEFGCFALTELGHGSNVAGIETTATYDHATRSFILHSPTATAAKWWIGGLAKNAVRSVVLARLMMDGEDQGVHAFVVPIRDQNYEVLPGLSIGDCGPKIDLNGIDNGFVLFNQYSVAYDCLLDRHSQITPEGKFVSSVSKKGQRTAALLAGLIRGRLGVVIGSECNLRTALTIAIRYAAVRRQFTEDDKQEVRLLDYPHHQFRVLSWLGRMMALKTVGDHLIDQYGEIRKLLIENPLSPEIEEFHAVMSCCKAVASWYATRGLQEIRESLGGHGYSTHSSIGRLRDSQDMHTTWEGDNTLLSQQTGKFLLKQAQKVMQGHKPSAKLAFLGAEPMPLSTKELDFKQTDTLMKLLEDRVNYLIRLCTEKLQQEFNNKGSVMKAWNSSQSFHILALSKAFAELIIMRAFHGNLPKEDTPTARVYRTCFVLYGLVTIQDDLRVFLEMGLTLPQVRTLENTLSEVLAEVATASVRIMDILGVADHLHGSALGRADGQVYAEIIRRVEEDPTCYQKAPWVETLLRMRETGKLIRNNS